MRDVRLAPSPIDAERELGTFLAGLDDQGAMVSFVGRARGRSKSGEPVERLHLDHHPRLTLRSMEDIAAAAASRFPVSAIRIVHRCGEVLAREPILCVAVASLHRRAAFEAADYLMDRHKTDAMFWKREEGPGFAAWIEPTDSDREERARWDG